MLKISLTIVLIFNFISIQCSKPKKSDLAIKVSADQLISEYEKDKSSANEKYAGQTIILSGKVSHFSVLRNTIGVYFKSTDAASRRIIICLIDMKSYPDDYSKINREIDGKFTGIIENDADKSGIFVNDCHLID